MNHPHRIKETLQAMLEVLGNRRIVIARELTKQYEEFVRGSIEEVLEIVDELRGEMVVIVEGSTEKKRRLFGGKSLMWWIMLSIMSGKDIARMKVLNVSLKNVRWRKTKFIVHII